MEYYFSDGNVRNDSHLKSLIYADPARARAHTRKHRTGHTRRDIHTITLTHTSPHTRRHAHARTHTHSHTAGIHLGLEQRCAGRRGLRAAAPAAALQSAETHHCQRRRADAPSEDRSVLCSCGLAGLAASSLRLPAPLRCVQWCVRWFVCSGLLVRVSIAARSEPEPIGAPLDAQRLLCVLGCAAVLARALAPSATLVLSDDHIGARD